MNDTGLPRIAICFFGITRSLTHTIGSIEKNILNPARDLGEVRVFAHFFRQTVIDNPRSGEKGTLKPGEHELLSPDWLELEEPEHCLAQHGFGELKAFGDEWDDDFRSLRNLIHQLHSLNRVTEAAVAWKPDIFIFVRPDLDYHDNFAPVLAKVAAFSDDSVWYPNWQLSGGLNDRFLICRGETVAQSYGGRINAALDFCRLTKQPLQSERLVAYVLQNSGTTLQPVRLRASRVRSNGAGRRENFDHPAVRRIKRSIVNFLLKLRLWSLIRRSST
jgi:hypothetical protein